MCPSRPSMTLRSVERNPAALVPSPYSSVLRPLTINSNSLFKGKIIDFFNPQLSKSTKDTDQRHSHRLNFLSSHLIASTFDPSLHYQHTIAKATSTMIKMQFLFVATVILFGVPSFIAVDAFVSSQSSFRHPARTLLEANPSSDTVSKNTKTSKSRRARDLILSLVEEEQCYTSELAAKVFGEACAANVVIEDRFYPQPFVGKTVSEPYMHLYLTRLHRPFYLTHILVVAPAGCHKVHVGKSGSAQRQRWSKD